MVMVPNAPEPAFTEAEIIYELELQDRSQLANTEARELIEKLFRNAKLRKKHGPVERKNGVLS